MRQTSVITPSDFRLCYLYSDICNLPSALCTLPSYEEEPHQSLLVKGKDSSSKREK
jgi:hypothetical protein